MCGLCSVEWQVIMRRWQMCGTMSCVVTHRRIACSDWGRSQHIHVAGDQMALTGLQEMSLVHIAARRHTVQSDVSRSHLSPKTSFEAVPCCALVPPYCNGASWCVTPLVSAVVTQYGLVTTIGVRLVLQGHNDLAFRGIERQVHWGAVRQQWIYFAYQSGRHLVGPFL